MTGFCPVSGRSFTSVEGYFQRVSKLTGFITGIIPAVCKLVCFIDYYGMFLLFNGCLEPSPNFSSENVPVFGSFHKTGSFLVS